MEHPTGQPPAALLDPEHLEHNQASQPIQAIQCWQGCRVLLGGAGEGGLLPPGMWALPVWWTWCCSTMPWSHRPLGPPCSSQVVLYLAATGCFFFYWTPPQYLKFFFEPTESKNFLDSIFFSIGPPAPQKNSQRISWTLICSALGCRAWSCILTPPCNPQSGCRHSAWAFVPKL